MLSENKEEEALADDPSQTEKITDKESTNDKVEHLVTFGDNEQEMFCVQFDQHDKYVASGKASLIQSFRLRRRQDQGLQPQDRQDGLLPGQPDPQRVRHHAHHLSEMASSERYDEDLECAGVHERRWQYPSLACDFGQVLAYDCADWGDPSVLLGFCGAGDVGCGGGEGFFD